VRGVDLGVALAGGEIARVGERLLGLDASWALMVSLSVRI
jgi:hypothetical protein